MTRSARNTRLFATASVLAFIATLACVALFAVQAHAAPLPGVPILTSTSNPLPGSNFQGGDGNEDDWHALNAANAAIPAYDDWQTFAGDMGLVVSDPSNPDKQFTGSKESDPDLWDFSLPNESTPGKTNFKAIARTFEANTFLHLMFRRHVNQGNSFLAFELNQDKRLWTNSQLNPIPCRTTGDILITFFVDNANADKIQVLLQRWVSDTSVTAAQANAAADASKAYFNGAGCARAGHTIRFDPPLPDAEGAINNVVNNNKAVELPAVGQPGRPDAGSIPNRLIDAVEGCAADANAICEGLFGEVSLNLGDILQQDFANPCFSFGSIWAHGRSSESDSSALQDYVEPHGIAVRRCTASGVKFHDLNGNGSQDAGEPGLGGWRVWADYNNDGVLDAGEPYADTSTDPAHLGEYTIANINPPNHTYSLRETGAPGTDTTGWVCSQPNGSPNPPEFTTGAGGGFTCGYGPLDPRVAGHENEVGMDFGNWRPPTITVTKQLSPAADPGLFDLYVDATRVAQDASDGAGNAATPLVVTSGNHTVSEQGGTGTTLGNYSSATECSINGAAAVPGATVNLQSGDSADCTVTNTRKSGVIEVRKDLVPDADPGKFDLSIGGTVVSGANGVGDYTLDAGQPFSRTVDTGSVSLSEAAHAGTDGSAYTSTWSCVDDNGTPNNPADDGATGASGTSGSVNVADGHTYLCTFTNTRKTGVIKIRKDLVPDADSGKFDLSIDGSVVSGASGVGDYTLDGNQPFQRTLNTGAGVAIGEAAHAGTDGSAYTSTWSCVDDNGTPNNAADDGATGASGTSGSVNVADGHTYLCTFVNTRRPGTIKVIKHLVPASDNGTFDLRVDGDTVAAGVGDNGQGQKSIAPGTYTVDELAHAGGVALSHYESSVSCDGGAATSGTSKSVTVDSNQTVTCTITNTRHGAIVIAKQTSDDGSATKFGFVPSGLSGGGFQLADNETKSFEDLLPGSGYGVDETQALHDGYRFSGAACDDGSPVSAIDVGPGETVTCTFNNAKLNPGIHVTKSGPAQAHEGDTVTYSFTVTNTGNSDLHSVSIDDDHCTNETRDPANDSNADGDTVLEVKGTDGNNPEVWAYTCTYDIPTPQAADVKNTVVATGLDEDDDQVSDQADHTLDVLHPALDVVKKQMRHGGAGGFVNTSVEVHQGDTLDYELTLTNTGDTPLHDITAIDDASLTPDGICDAAPVFDGNDSGAANVLDVGETWTYHCSHLVTGADATVATLHNEAYGSGLDPKGQKAADQDGINAKVDVPSTLVVKEGNTFAYPGDKVTYTFDVTNKGNTPLHDVTVTDDKCSPVTRDASGDKNINTGSDPGNATLDNPGQDGSTSESWRFTCTRTIPADHKIGDENPIHNTATATGVDPLGQVVNAQDSHDTRILHPAIKIAKTGPAEKLAGDKLDYGLVVTNPGDVVFARDNVVVTDPGCDSTPALIAKYHPTAADPAAADPTPDQLDPGDAWAYTCSYQSAKTETSHVNTAFVVGTDPNGHVLKDQSTVTTKLDQIAVLPEKATPGASRLVAPEGCTKSSFTAKVTGKEIAQVTFFLDGKKVKRLKGKSGQLVFKLKLSTQGRSYGVHRVRAKVIYTAKSLTKSKSMLVTFQRCAKQVVKPQFTG